MARPVRSPAGLRGAALAPPRISPKGGKVTQDTHLEIAQNAYLMGCKEISGGRNKDYASTQDGAPAHRANAVQEFRARARPNVTDRKAWPPTSPDLNPVDYFAWGYLQMEVNNLAPSSPPDHA